MHHLIYIMQIKSVIFFGSNQDRSTEQSQAERPRCSGSAGLFVLSLLGCLSWAPAVLWGTESWLCSCFWAGILLWGVPLKRSNPCCVSQGSCTASPAPPRPRAWSPPPATSPSAPLARSTPSASAAATLPSAMDPAPRRGAVLLRCPGHTWWPLFCSLNWLCCFCTAKLQASWFVWFVFSPWRNLFCILLSSKALQLFSVCFQIPVKSKGSSVVLWRSGADIFVS